MIFYKSSEEIELIRQSSLLVAKTHAEIAKFIQPGIKTNMLDKKAEEFIRDNGGVPAFKGYRDFPNTLCISVDDQVVHGIPDDTILEEGSIVSVDCGVVMNGFFGDSAYSFAVGELNTEKLQLLKITKEALYKGIEMSVEGKRVGDISSAIQYHAESNGFSVVRELVGHGVGRALHEKPDVPNYGKKGSGSKLKVGMVLAIEPMINAGEKSVIQGDNGWTIIAVDGLPSAHFEHTVAVGKEKADILSSFKYIEEELRINKKVLI